MIKIIDGDLFDSKADIIAHQVNCMSIMGSGLAKQIRIKYPEVYKQYKSLCERVIDKKSLLGMCQVVSTNDGKCIANMFGQFGYGYDGKQYTDLNALKKAMCYLRDVFVARNNTIAFPYGLGSVRGGANFEDVYAIIEEVFADYDVEIWRLDKG